MTEEGLTRILPNQIESIYDALPPQLNRYLQIVHNKLHMVVLADSTWTAHNYKARTSCCNCTEFAPAVAEFAIAQLPVCAY